MGILEKLQSFPPRYGPEWGSGGIFGLKYHRETLYFTLAFEGEAHFITSDSHQVYEFQLVGPRPTSGGDTYNAVETVDEFIYFGGWVHAPAKFRGKREGKATIDFSNKYSHVHEYDTSTGRIRLVWKESLHHPEKWVGEVSEIIYNPYTDELLLAREDGHENLGVYSLDRRRGGLRRLLSKPSPKGTQVHDVAFFGVGKNYTKGLEGIYALDMVTEKWDEFKLSGSIDGEGYVEPHLGAMASVNNRAFAFVRGGVFVGNPYNGEEFRFVRLFDFPTFYAPFRVNALNFGGGIIIAFNSHHDAYYKPRTEEEKLYHRFTNTIVGPSVLVYIAPPLVKIVGTFGARVTSIENAGDKLLVATNTTPNTGALDATPFDTGYRNILVFDHEIININNSPPVRFSVPLIRNIFGGIPLDGYKEPRIILKLSQDAKLIVHEYDLALPLEESDADSFDVRRGRDVIDLSAFSGIVSFKLEGDANGKAIIELR
ncbi:DUF2139 domain-containing protein [Pyrococcus abyssi]|uniref:Phosphate ABC transporter substrate-binding protein n=1 Tax=Pyrococcus abyssi (strain GE5 / Orsay) TaxID=272844 RepID=Q9V272_PYRAB|nr:DUF2139 domain-containing protein [Pyrococcus abyssi]CAB49126.1 Hypothetical protein PAB0137 [Pyrococcus abyssi GE5]CCE69578.1 TPA: hypothetical protein PAB0137 [Pyrococcus abyssi GE5]